MRKQALRFTSQKTKQMKVPYF